MTYTLEVFNLAGQTICKISNLTSPQIAAALPFLTLDDDEIDYRFQRSPHLPAYIRFNDDTGSAIIVSLDR